jgi:type I restriction enzyme S subunit
MWCRLGDVFNVKSSKRVHKSEWKKSGIPFYRAREIVKLSQSNLVDNDLFISEEHYLDLKGKYGVPKENDILISAVGTIGKTYVVKNNDKFYYKDASVLCLSNIYSLNSSFVEILLASSIIQSQMYENSKGTTVDTITIEKANQYRLPIPPLAEQQRIVQKIENIFKQLDKIQESL